MTAPSLAKNPPPPPPPNKPPKTNPPPNKPGRTGPTGVPGKAPHKIGAHDMTTHKTASRSRHARSVRRWADLTYVGYGLFVGSVGGLSLIAAVSR